MFIGEKPPSKSKYNESITIIGNIRLWIQRYGKEYPISRFRISNENGVCLNNINLPIEGVFENPYPLLQITPISCKVIDKRFISFTNLIS